MKSSGNLTGILIAVLAVVAVVILALKIIGGAVSLVNSAFNVILCVVVAIALIAIVIWMFAYAKKKK